MGVLRSLFVLPVLLIAAAGPITDRAATALARDPVYVDPDADMALSDGEADRLRDAIRDGDAAIYVAVLPGDVLDEVGGGADDVIGALEDATGLSGTYAVVAGQSFRAGRSPQARAAATAAFNHHGSDGLYAVLADFVDRVQSGNVAVATGGNGSDSDNDNGGGGLLPWLVVGGAAAGGVYLLTRNRKRVAVDKVALQAAQQDLQAELSVLADDVLRLDPEVTATPAARPDYDAAVSRFRWLEAAIPAIDSPDDPPRIQRAMDEARYAMARAQAIVRGQEPPPPPASLTQPGRYGEPAVEIDEDDDERRPRYAGRGGGWYGGGFFGGGDMFTGLLIGSMLGGGGGWGGHHDHGGFLGGGTDGDDGPDVDFGGGDFGGGDFGGGDFGGGDFGS